MLFRSRSGIALDAPGPKGTTPLIEAVRNGRADAVRALIDLRASPTAPARDGRSPAWYAVGGPHPEILSALKPPAAELNRSGLLLEASEHHNLGAIRALLAAGADVNVRHNDVTPLLVAAERGWLDEIALLLDAHADPNVLDRDGRTPLMRLTLLAPRNFEEFVRKLSFAKADIDLHGDSEPTALMYAAQSGRAENVETLIVAGAKVDARTSSGRTPLHFAVRPGHRDAPRALEALLRARPDLNAKDDAGRTPLMEAVQHHNVNAVRRLLLAGANPALRDLRGFSAADVAQEAGTPPSIADMLRSNPTGINNQRR